MNVCLIVCQGFYLKQPECSCKWPGTVINCYLSLTYHFLAISWHFTSWFHSMSLHKSFFIPFHLKKKCKIQRTSGKKKIRAKQLNKLMDFLCRLGVWCQRPACTALVSDTATSHTGEKYVFSLLLLIRGGFEGGFAGFKVDLMHSIQNTCSNRLAISYICGTAKGSLFDPANITWAQLWTVFRRMKDTSLRVTNLIFIYASTLHEVKDSCKSCHVLTAPSRERLCLAADQGRENFCYQAASEPPPQAGGANAQMPLKKACQKCPWGQAVGEAFAHKSR